VLGSILGKLFIKDEIKEENGEAVKQSTSAAYKELMDAAATMALILFYFYICDR